MTVTLSTKRSLIQAFDAFPYHEITSSVTSSLAKRRRCSASDKSVTKIQTRSTPRVRFATALVQEREIPFIEDDVEKTDLYYSDEDFVRFAFNERIRRDALILTITLCREQQKRLFRGSTVIPPSSVQLMYHKILSRRSIKSEKPSGSKNEVAQTRERNKKKVQPVAFRVIEKRRYAARCA